MRPCRALLLLAAAALPAAAADPVVERALAALQEDSSLKVRTQAALVLGSRGARQAVPALGHALATDEAPSVRIAAAAALARLADLAGREPLEAASRADPDPAVRNAAARALAELLAVSVRSVALEEAHGQGGKAGREALRESLARHLRRQGFAVVGPGEPAGYRLKASVLELDVSQAEGKTVIAVKASVVAVDSQGKMAAMVEGGARLRASGGSSAAAQRQLTDRALDAAAVSLSEDLAARLR
ncbi:MAG: HEAT repeat domain-containing protein [Deltaproteobacteria bacterium]|nr:HEAT repeat domain-containing protein [Deltaproteobacteria bacterium]